MGSNQEKNGGRKSRDTLPLRADAFTSWMPQLKCNISAYLLIIKFLYVGVFNATFRESFFYLNALFIHQLPDKHFQVEYPI